MAFSIYIAASYRHLHAVQLLGAALQEACPDVVILDWTQQAVLPAGLSPAERRTWMDTDQGGEVFAFCRHACTHADLVIYLGESGQDAGVEVGMAAAMGIPTLGLAGPLEAPGVMLNGAISYWARSVDDLRGMVHGIWAGLSAAR